MKNVKSITDTHFISYSVEFPGRKAPMFTCAGNCLANVKETLSTMGKIVTLMVAVPTQEVDTGAPPRGLREGT